MHVFTKLKCIDFGRLMKLSPYVPIAQIPTPLLQAMVRALEAAETPMSFPASALRHSATWLIDQDSAVLLAGTKG